jgi:hypothetical protein
MPRYGDMPEFPESPAGSGALSRRVLLLELDGELPQDSTQVLDGVSLGPVHV